MDKVIVIEEDDDELIGERNVTLAECYRPKCTEYYCPKCWANLTSYKNAETCYRCGNKLDWSKV